MNDAIKIINRIDDKDLNEFLNNVDSNVSLETKGKIVTLDTSWVDMVEETIPYLDTIIRNPRRFIVQEENIVPIEKAKVVTEESIKHLAQHTSLIQDVDEDGNVVPLKLLNVYREETVDLYENRFVKSLVDNLYVFVNNKLKENNDVGTGNLTNKLNYSGNTKIADENIKINLQLESSGEDSSSGEMDDNLRKRIENIKEIVSAFHNSKFIKSLNGCVPVRSPIRKTNVILKEQNFKKALELWEFLEKNNIKPFTKSVDIDEVISDSELKSLYDTSFYVNNLFLKCSDNYKLKGNLCLDEIINDMVYYDNYTEEEIMNILNNEVQNAFDKKEKIISEIDNEVSNAVIEIKDRFNNAIMMLN